mgnify:CR=1 FL=1
MSFRSASLLVCALACTVAAPFALAAVPPQKPPVVHVDPEAEKLPADRVKATVENYKRWLDAVEARDAAPEPGPAVIVPGLPARAK